MAMFEELKNITKDVEGSYVYILLASNDYIKIGRSKDPYKRFNSLSGSNSCGYQLVRYYLSPAMSCDRLVEKILHNRFHRYRTNGEWFYGQDLYYEDVIASLDEITKSEIFARKNT